MPPTAIANGADGFARLWEAMLSDRILFIDAEAIVLDKPAGLAGRRAAARRGQHRGAHR